MNSLSQTLALQEIKLSRNRELIELGTYISISFFVPFLLGHPQLLVGTLVNAALVLSALHLKDHKILPIIMLPSVAVLARGLIFGPFTMYLIYTLPFIWLGNLALVYFIKRLYLNFQWNKYLSLAISIIIKVLLLYLSASMLIKLGVLPKVFAISMGTIQLYTALLGSSLALISQKVSRAHK